jgi:hypothetical protein
MVRLLGFFVRFDAPLISTRDMGFRCDGAYPRHIAQSQLKLGLASFLAGSPALFHESREFGATGGTHAAAAPLLRGTGSLGRAPSVSRGGDSFEGCDRVTQAVSLRFEFAKNSVSVHVIPFST